MKKSNLFRVFVLGGAGIILALLLVTSTMKAQCPSDISPTAQGWNGPVTATYVWVCAAGTSCTVTATYCWRIVPHGPSDDTNSQSTYETFMNSVSMTGNCDCVTGPLEIYYGMLATFNAFPNQAPPCGGVDFVTWKGYRSPCWHHDINGNTTACGNGDGYCVETCKLCGQSGKVYSADCTFTTEGTPSCHSNGPPPQNWQASNLTCYEITCGNQ